MSRAYGAGLSVFTIIGIAFVAIGITTQQAFLYIGLVFIGVGLVARWRSGRGKGT